MKRLLEFRCRPVLDEDLKNSALKLKNAKELLVFKTFSDTLVKEDLMFLFRI